MGVRGNGETGDSDGDEEGAEGERREIADIGDLTLMKDIEAQGDGHEQEAKQGCRCASHEGIEGSPLRQGLLERHIHRRSQHTAAGTLAILRCTRRSRQCTPSVQHFDGFLHEVVAPSDRTPIRM